MKKKAYLMVLALCAALAITACGTSTDQKDDKKPAAEAQDTTDKEDSGSDVYSHLILRVHDVKVIVAWY